MQQASSIRNESVIEVPFLSDEECNTIRDFFHWKEEELIRDGYGDHKENVVFKNILTSNYFRYNFFHYFPDLADRLAEMLNATMHPNNLEWPLAVQAWCNVYRTGDGIDWHNHQGIMGQSFTANIFIDGPTAPGLYYKPFNEKATVLENKKGYIQILPCELYHKVPPNESEDARYTIGLTIHSYPIIGKTLIDRYAFNSKTYQDTIILTREHMINEDT